MKRIVWLFLIVMFFSINGIAQNNKLKFSKKHWKKERYEWRATNLDATVGYVPKASAQALKTSIALNNLLFERLGLFSSLEYGLNSNDLYNTVGGTFTANEYIYFWGGIDLFTKNGLIQTKSMGIRKEVGIGIIPFKRLVVQVGASLSVGVTISAGYKITW